MMVTKATWLGVAIATIADLGERQRPIVGKTSGTYPVTLAEGYDEVVARFEAHQDRESARHRIEAAQAKQQRKAARRVKEERLRLRRQAERAQ